MSGIRKVVKVNQKKLQKISAKKGSIYVGATKDYHQRADVHQTPRGGGYTGTMYVAKTENMMKAEDKVLYSAISTGGGRHNVHEFSNAREKPGHIYVINGQKRPRNKKQNKKKRLN